MHSLSSTIAVSHQASCSFKKVSSGCLSGISSVATSGPDGAAHALFKHLGNYLNTTANRWCPNLCGRKRRPARISGKASFKSLSGTSYSRRMMPCSMTPFNLSTTHWLAGVKGGSGHGELLTCAGNYGKHHGSLFHGHCV